MPRLKVTWFKREPFPNVLEEGQIMVHVAWCCPTIIGTDLFIAIGTVSSSRRFMPFSRLDAPSSSCKGYILNADV